MIFSDLLNRAIEIIGDDEIDITVSSEKRDRLVSCGRMIHEELCREYIDVKYKENLEFSNNKLFYSQFSKRLKKVIGIKKDGERIKYELYPEYLEAEVDGTAEVVYAYYPDASLYSANLELPPQFTLDAIAMGVVGEYFYRLGLTDCAVYYKNRYDIAILNLTRENKGFILKRRSIV